MRLMSCLLIFFILIFSVNISLPIKAERKSSDQSIIIEVEGDPEQHKTYFEVYHPFIKVITTYKLLFNGLALQAPPEKLAKISSLPFIKALHSVHTYEVSDEIANTHSQSSNTVMPSDLNNSAFTGKGVKVGVIDTGIDYTHPDLVANYVGGYDLVDLDDDPMETMATVDGDIPTIHGTHVAGIIAANGKIQGVAPEASIYAYRALGPGGRGSTIQVIAALEQAVKDEVDIINMSLGNSINGPDYPTSVAVNRAVDLGVAVVVANGNDGPNDWTVGSPATATNALAVGASSNSQTIPYLYERMENKKIPLTSMIGSVPWEIDKEYPITHVSEEAISGLWNKIAVLERGKTPFFKLAKSAEKAGAVAVVIANNEPGRFQGSVEDKENPLTIPVASISKAGGEFIKNNRKGDSLYIETKYEQIEAAIAPFSSRGPVTINWNIKPDVLAPGMNVLSTIPNDYAELNGTSMAAPHVTGAIAVMKEAHPSWTNDQIIGALKTAAIQMEDDQGQLIKPTIQGMGQINIEKAIQVKTIMEHPILAFGKIDEYKETKNIEVNIKNNSNDKQTYFFNMPKKTAGVVWKLPQSFTLEGKEQRSIPIELSVTTSLLNEGIHQGWLTLNEHDETFQIPYMFINKQSDHPKVMGFDFSLKAYDQDTYEYHLYVTEKARSVQVTLYNPDTLVYDQTLLEISEVQLGLNEGYIKKVSAIKKGHYMSIITVQLEDGSFASHGADFYID